MGRAVSQRRCFAAYLGTQFHLLTVARGRGLFWLDPNDIGRIEILKDVSALAMYGVRGANGVVLITTRHGERQPN